MGLVVGYWRLCTGFDTPMHTTKTTGVFDQKYRYSPLNITGVYPKTFLNVYYYALWQGASVAIPMGLVALLLPKKNVASSKNPAKPPYRGKSKFQIGF